MSGLLSLPDELLIKILDFGGHSTIVACQQTCRRMNDLAKGSLALQYAVSLAAAGLLDNVPTVGNLAERMKLLVAHERAWKDTPWFPISGYDGVLGLAASSGNLLVFFRLWDDSARFSRNLVFQRLPSIHRGAPDFSARKDPDFHMHEFSIDASQDLLVYAHGHHLVTREVGTNRPHPASRTGVLSLRPNELPIPTTTRIYGKLAACLTTFIDDGSLRFRIFNWTTGELVTESVSQIPPVQSSETSNE
ncbi:hypothetical protein BC827DRAFT_1200129 [Russula dissimulans]|nr:hypothetical protein BC827DRAFT_1200129 [Russula dissimulans]